MTGCSPDQLLATGYGDSVCGKRTRVADHAPEGMMNAGIVISTIHVHDECNNKDKEILLTKTGFLGNQHLGKLL